MVIGWYLSAARRPAPTPTPKHGRRAHRAASPRLARSHLGGAGTRGAASLGTRGLLPGRRVRRPVLTIARPKSPRETAGAWTGGCAAGRRSVGRWARSRSCWLSGDGGGDGAVLHQGEGAPEEGDADELVGRDRLPLDEHRQGDGRDREGELAQRGDRG